MIAPRFLRWLPLFALISASHAAPALTSADLTAPFQPAVRKGALQAVSVGVIQPNHTATGHTGKLTPDTAQAPDDRTLYEIGSISKVFTALLLADAVVRGEVTLDTPIARLLPADVKLPDDVGEKITLRMLATHTSGLPRLPAGIPVDDPTNPYATFGETELWNALRQVRLNAAPGSAADYSNFAAGLLGTLLARRAGLSYPQLLAERITGPLGMTDTVVTLSDEQRTRFIPGFNAAGEAVSAWDFQALAGAGGIRSTVTDMLRFAQAVLKPGSTPLEAALQLQWERQPLKASLMPGGQALGWMIAGDRQTRWHNGMTGGFHSILYVNQGLGVAVVMLCNRATDLGSPLAEGLVRRAAGVPEPKAPNQDRAEVALTVEQLDRCVGTFRLAPQFALVFERRGQGLFLTPTGQSTDRLYSASPDTFFSRRVAADIVFELPEGGGPATRLVLKQNGRTVPGVRE